MTEKIIKSIRGKDKIGHEGYFYNYIGTEMGIKRWRCNRRGCTSILETNISNELRDVGIHGHLKDEYKYNQTLLKEKIKTRALSSAESNRNVVLKVLKENLDMKIPLNLKYLNTYVNKERKVNNYTVPKDYDIPEELQVTVENKQFLFYDSGIKDVSRVLIFSTEENFRHVGLSKVLMCDGTFKTAPSGFKQIFTLQIKIREMFLPMIFCFMKDTKEESYDKIFTWLKKKNPDLVKVSKSIIIDFEQASYNSLSRHLVNSNVYGCNFHLGQIVWRRIQNLKFSTQFINNPKIKLLVKMMLALSFVPTVDVTMVAARLKNYIIEEKSLDVLMLFEWFQGEYLQNESGNKATNFWNVFERTQLGVPRTTNSLEGYHRHLNTFISAKQTSIIPILNELKNEQFIVENKILYSLHNESSKHADPVQHLIDLYSVLDSIDYLKKIALNHNWKLD